MRILIPITLLLIIGCSETKKTQKAENRVLADVESVKRVRAKTDALFPCLNDSTTVWEHDTTYIPQVKTVKEIKYDTIEKDNKVYLLYRDTIYKERVITKQITVGDGRETKKLSDSLLNRTIQLSYYKGRNAELNEDKAALKKSNTKLWWLVIAVVVAGVLSHVFRSKIFPIKLS